MLESLYDGNKTIFTKFQNSQDQRQQTIKNPFRNGIDYLRLCEVKTVAIISVKALRKVVYLSSLIKIKSSHDRVPKFKENILSA